MTGSQQEDTFITRLRRDLREGLSGDSAGEHVTGVRYNHGLDISRTLGLRIGQETIHLRLEPLRPRFVETSGKRRFPLPSLL